MTIIMAFLFDDENNKKRVSILFFYVRIIVTIN